MDVLLDLLVFLITILVILVLLLIFLHAYFIKSTRVEYKVDKARVVDKRKYVSVSDHNEKVHQFDKNCIYYIYLKYENDDYCIEDKMLYNSVKVGDYVDVNVKKVWDERKKEITSITLVN